MRRRNLIDAIMHERDPLRLRALFYEWEETRTLADGRKRWKGTGADKGKYRTQKTKPGTAGRSKGHDPDKRRALTARILQLVESPHEVTDDSLAALKDELKGLSREQLAAVRRELNIRRGGRRKGEEIDTIAGHVSSKRKPASPEKIPTASDKTRAMLEALSGRPDGLYQVGGAHGKLVQVKGGKAQVVNAVPVDVQLEAEVKRRQGQATPAKPQPGKQDLGTLGAKAERKRDLPARKASEPVPAPPAAKKVKPFKFRGKKTPTRKLARDLASAGSRNILKSAIEHPEFFGVGPYMFRTTAEDRREIADGAREALGDALEKVIADGYALDYAQFVPKDFEKSPAKIVGEMTRQVTSGKKTSNVKGIIVEAGESGQRAEFNPKYLGEVLSRFPRATIHLVPGSRNEPGPLVFLDGGTVVGVVMPRSGPSGGRDADEYEAALKAVG